MHNPYFGAIDTGAKETDYQLGADIQIQRARCKFQDNEIEYNQKEVSAVSCTIHGAMGAVSDLTGYKFTLEERKSLWREALALGADPKIGWYTSDAIDLVRNFYNAKFPDKPLTSFRASVGSEQYSMMLRLGYSAVISHRGNKKYSEDEGEDGILDGTSFGETTYGHCLRTAYSVGDLYDLYINNYAGVNDFNVYRVPSTNTIKLLASRVLFSACYFFVESYENKTPAIPLWAKSSYDKAIAKGVISAGDDIFRAVADSAAEQVFIATGLLSKAEGNISLIRLLVALDRLKKLD